MKPQRFQQTIINPCHVSGRGYWSGNPISVTFRPAGVNTGIIFRRVDLDRKPDVAALSTHREETSLRTRLVHGDCRIDMVEHALAALHGLGIDNCYVDCNAEEMPGLDGSSLRYALALEQAGVVRQGALRNIAVITTPFKIGTDDQWVMALPSNDPYLSCEYRLDYGPQASIPAGTVRFAIEPETFTKEIAPARTFVNHFEAELLQKQGLAKHVTHRDLLVFGPSGPIDNTLRYDDECSRHKLLDLIGDLALCGFAIHGKIVACRSGHILNGRMAEHLRTVALEQSIANIPTSQTSLKVRSTQIPLTAKAA